LEILRSISTLKNHHRSLGVGKRKEGEKVFSRIACLKEKIIGKKI